MIGGREADASRIAPIIAVPTTAGTGSEVGRASVITHPETHEKKIIFHPAIMPKVALLDTGTYDWVACKTNSGNWHGRFSALLGGLLCALLSSHGQGHSA